MKYKPLLNRKKISLIVLILLSIAVGCKKNNSNPPVKTTETSTNLTQDEKISIAKAGFSPTNAIRVKGGFIVEGDILLKQADLDFQSQHVEEIVFKKPTTEQYRTLFIVSTLTNAIKVKVSAGAAQTVFTTAATKAIKRYNDLGLTITFALLDSSSTDKEDILITGQDFGDPNILGQSSGFPGPDGKPATPITLNSVRYNKDFQDKGELVTVIAHEIGHTIGFRHTDYANRAYSCGYDLSSWIGILQAIFKIPVNEGSFAIYIPGTPLGGEAGSWMLACSDGTDRPFTPSDIVALKALYPVKQ
ncbi:MAG: Dual-action metallo-peptidase [Mucilaginibacter sp.]|nr:Dual-action metallo-peptidase [Mucilaginibacter sp.]